MSIIEKNKALIVFTIFLFCVFSTISFSLPDKKIIERFSNENYSIIVVEIPELMYNPEVWKEVSNDVVSVEKFIGFKTDYKFNQSSKRSISQIADNFDGIVYVDSPNYAYSKIILPKENYDKANDTFRSLGFKVSENLIVKPLLDYSRNVIGLPYFYGTPDGTIRELTGSGKTIAIIDSGVDISHPDLDDRVVFWNDTSDERLSCCVDEDGHGTHVASIAAGTGDGSSGKYKGVAPNANLKVWKVNKDNHYDDYWIAEAIRQATREKVDVISLSLGTFFPTADMCTGQSSGGVQEWYDAIINALNNGITVVVAAGNEGPENNSIAFPACMDGVITVGSAIKKHYSDDYTNGLFAVRTDTPRSDTARVHVLIFSNGVKILDKEWEALTSTTLKRSGFNFVFQPSSFPATVEIRIEGEHRDRKCWPMDCNSPECISWDPGGDEKSDEFWLFGDIFDSGPYIAVDIFVQPVSEHGACLPWDLGWWNNYLEPFEYPNYIRVYKTSYFSNEGQVHYTSSRGPTPQGTQKPDITAPGIDICAAKAADATLEEDECTMSCGNDNYISCSGTSMAAPVVAGLVALIKEIKPSSTKEEIIDALKKTDEKILTGNPDYDEGFGRINSEKAIDFITNCASKASIDSDSGNNPMKFGACFDYTSWTGNGCAVSYYPENCSTSFVYETYAFGNTCANYWKNCADYGSTYFCSSGSCYSTSSGGGGGGGRHWRK